VTGLRFPLGFVFLLCPLASGSSTYDRRKQVCYDTFPRSCRLGTRRTPEHGAIKLRCLLSSFSPPSFILKRPSGGNPPSGQEGKNLSSRWRFPPTPLSIALGITVLSFRPFILFSEVFRGLFPGICFSRRRVRILYPSLSLSL